MATNRGGMFLLDITEEDVRKSLPQNKIFGISKNTVIESLWQYPIIASFLLKENPAAVIYINTRRGTLGEEGYLQAVKYHLVKRTAQVLRFLQNEMSQVIMTTTSSFKSSKDFTKFTEATSSIFGFVDELYTGNHFTQPNLYTLRKDTHLKGLFQLWLLMYSLAEKENIEKNSLLEASLALRTLLADWRV